MGVRAAKALSDNEPRPAQARGPPVRLETPGPERLSRT